MSHKTKKIQAQIKSNLAAQKATRIKQMRLHNQENDLQHKLNKADPGYKEIYENVKEGRKNVKRLIGRIHWRERFKDEDTGKSFFVNRSRICSIDGKPCDHFGLLLKYYNLSKVE